MTFFEFPVSKHRSAAAGRRSPTGGVKEDGVDGDVPSRMRACRTRRARAFSSQSKICSYACPIVRLPKAMAGVQCCAGSDASKQCFK